MKNLFGYLLDADNYDDRKVDRWDGVDKMLSTAQVSDGAQPYETCWQHPEFKGGQPIIVEAYATREEAQAGHVRWLKVMLEGPLPDELTDCCNAACGQIGREIGMTTVFKRGAPAPEE